MLICLCVLVSVRMGVLAFFVVSVFFVSLGTYWSHVSFKLI